MKQRGTTHPARGSVRVHRYAPTWVLLIAAVVLFGFGRVGRHGRDGSTIDFADQGRSYVVARVVDGDTLLLTNGERVRLLGVDTPESVAPDRPVEALGPEASEFTRRLVEGRSIKLSFDKERTDRYGRTLAYAYVDGLLLNEEIIRAGLSEAQLHFPYSSAMKRRFREAELAARENRRGLWADLYPGDGAAKRRSVTVPDDDSMP